MVQNLRHANYRFRSADKVEPPGEAELGGMNEFAPQLGWRLDGPSPEF